MLSKISALAKVSLLSMMLAGPGVWAQAEDAMSKGELDEMIDDLGGGQNATSESSGMNGGGGGSSAMIETPAPTTIASTPPMDNSMDDSPREYVSTPARDLDDDNGPDEEGGVDREVGESGTSEGYYSSGDSGSSGATPEPMFDSPYRNMNDGPTPIPTGDKYNSDYSGKHKKKVAKKSKKSKKKFAKASKHSKKQKIAKHKSKRRDVASAKSKHKKKSKDKRVASRKSSKHRYR